MDFHVVHIPKTGTKITAESLPFGALVFETCLRRIVFFSSDLFLSQPNNQKWLQKHSTQYEIFRGEEAYKFVLEVICGLHSLIKGETEIFGQFREFFNDQKAEIDSNGMTDVFKQWIVDCKNLRSTRIQNWSHNTYGSVTRKLLNSNDGVALLGGGQLAREIAPWLKHVKSKSILLRQPRDLEPQFSGFRIEMTQNWDCSEDVTVVVIAANISNSELNTHLSRWPNVRLVVDWRGDESLPVTKARDVFRLHDLKQVDERSKREESERIELVIGEIQTKALEFAKKAKHNPWGWEDFCA